MYYYIDVEKSGLELSYGLIIVALHGTSMYVPTQTNQKRVEGGICKNEPFYKL